jgi:hypothetical protein
MHLLGWTTLMDARSVTMRNNRPQRWWVVFGTGRYLARVGSLSVRGSSKFRIALSQTVPYVRFREALKRTCPIPRRGANSDR